MNSHEAWLIPDDVSDEDLDNWAWERAVEHAESYGIYPPSDDGEEEGYVEPKYSGSNISGSWRLFKGKDLGKVTYGNNDGPQWNEW
jgi:hypothetical protein